jgi:hypothetical protein
MEPSGELLISQLSQRFRSADNVWAMRGIDYAELFRRRRTNAPTPKTHR